MISKRKALESICKNSEDTVEGRTLTGSFLSPIRSQPLKQSGPMTFEKLISCISEGLYVAQRLLFRVANIENRPEVVHEVFLPGTLLMIKNNKRYKTSNCHRVVSLTYDKQVSNDLKVSIENALKDKFNIPEVALAFKLINMGEELMIFMYVSYDSDLLFENQNKLLETIHDTIIDFDSNFFNTTGEYLNLVTRRYLGYNPIMLHIFNNENFLIEHTLEVDTLIREIMNEGLDDDD